jgi:hypothetical protein
MRTTGLYRFLMSSLYRSGPSTSLRVARPERGEGLRVNGSGLATILKYSLQVPMLQALTYWRER